LRTPPPLERSFDAVVMVGFDDGRKRRYAAEGDQRGDGYGRRPEERGRDGDGRLGGGSRQEGGGGGFRYADEQGPRGSSRGREEWSSPPPCWREQQRWEEEQRDRFKHA
jgi:hypothetical protein